MSSCATGPFSSVVFFASFTRFPRVRPLLHRFLLSQLIGSSVHCPRDPLDFRVLINTYTSRPIHITPGYVQQRHFRSSDYFLSTDRSAHVTSIRVTNVRTVTWPDFFGRQGVYQFYCLRMEFRTKTVCLNWTATCHISRPTCPSIRLECMYVF